MIENFVMYAMKNYQNPHCSTAEEFQKDLDKFSYINKLFNRHYEKNDSNTHLILNHIIVLYNVFDTEACTEMLFYKGKKEYWAGIKTILTYLSYMPEHIKCISVRDSDIPIDMNIADDLRKI